MRFLKHMFSFNGRIKRSTYFIHNFLSIIIIIAWSVFILKFFVALEKAFPQYGSMDIYIIPLLGIGVFLFVLSELSTTTRRFHDINRSGFSYFFLLIPIYNIYLGLALFLQKGTSGSNPFGAEPQR